MTMPSAVGEALDPVAGAQPRDLGAQRRVAALERARGLHGAADARVELQQRHLRRDEADEAEGDDADPHAPAHEPIHEAAGRHVDGDAGDPRRDRHAAVGEALRSRRAGRARGGGDAARGA